MLCRINSIRNDLKLSCPLFLSTQRACMHSMYLYVYADISMYLRRKTILEQTLPGNCSRRDSLRCVLTQNSFLCGATQIQLYIVHLNLLYLIFLSKVNVYIIIICLHICKIYWLYINLQRLYAYPHT